MHVVVERCEAEQAEERRARRVDLVRVEAGQRAAHSLGAAGGSRGVEHRGAHGAVPGWFVGLTGAKLGQRPEIRDLADREPRALVESTVDRGVRGHLGEPLVGDECLGATVFQDVGHLRPDEMPVHRDDVDGRESGDAGVLHRIDLTFDLRTLAAELVEQPLEHGAVGQHQHDGIAGFQTHGPQPARIAVGTLGKRAVAEGLPVLADHGRVIRALARDVPQPDHWFNLERVSPCRQARGPARRPGSSPASWSRRPSPRSGSARAPRRSSR